MDEDDEDEGNKEDKEEQEEEDEKKYGVTMRRNRSVYCNRGIKDEMEEGFD